MREVVGDKAAEALERMSRAVYERGRDIALGRGIIIADTKFEFGRDVTGRIILIDEVLTPDSSRFWPQSGYRAGRPQPSSTSSPCAIFSMPRDGQAAGTAMRPRRN